jgi:hypothetical protein
MNRRLTTGILLNALLLAACSGGASSGGQGGTGGASSGSGGAAATTSGGGVTTTTSGAGGAASCSACVTLLSLEPGSQPLGLFVDEQHLYWTQFGTGQVMQAALDGSGAVTIASGEQSPVAVQAAGGFVYWVSYAATGVARRAPIGGGTVADLAPAAGARELFVGDEHVWWTGEPDDLWRAPIAGLPQGKEPDLLSNNGLPNGLAVDAHSLYWVNRLDGAIKKADHVFGGEMVLATGDVPWDVAVDETSIYWTEQGSDQGTGAVRKASKLDGSSAVLLASEGSGPRGLAIDAKSVYWANKEDGTIKAVPLGGGPVTVIAAGQDQPANVVVDADFVYWTNFRGDTIVKIAK